MKFPLRILQGVLIGFMYGQVAQADVTFFDGTFNDADWQIPILYQGYNGGTVSAHQVAVGGNPGSYQEVDTTMNSVGPNPWSNIVAFHEQTSAAYDPSVQGAINKLDFSMDVRNYTGLGLAIGVAIEQNGALYAPLPLGTNGPTSWTHYTELNLTANDFYQVISTPPTFSFQPSPRPDFSASGAPIAFGFYTFEATTDIAYTINAGYDNWSVTVHSLPEPASLLLIVAGSVMLFAERGARWKSRRSKRSSR